MKDKWNATASCSAHLAHRTAAAPGTQTTSNLKWSYPCWDLIMFWFHNKYVSDFTSLEALFGNFPSKHVNLQGHCNLLGSALKFKPLFVEQGKCFYKKHMTKIQTKQQKGLFLWNVLGANKPRSGNSLFRVNVLVPEMWTNGSTSGDKTGKVILDRFMV